MNKHDRLRIESWCKKFCQITTNIDWKRNRNLHAISLLNMIINNHFEEPYTKFPPDGPLPHLSKPIVKCSLSQKFYTYTANIFDLPFPENIKRGNSNNLINDNSRNDKLKKAITPGKNNFKNTKSNKNNQLLQISKCNDPDLLKKLIEKLHYRINETNNIINLQNEEKKILMKKISQLENLIKSYKI